MATKNGKQPATKQDLDDLKQELREEMAGLKSELLEAVHDSETRLLKAFYGYTESTARHFADVDQADSGFRQRLGVLEERVTEIERRINTPPAR